MEVVGIVAEYNPFHNGHLWQIEKIREKLPGALIVCVMSGNITQRGELTILDKWQRAKAAVLGGCDLVLELPFVFACRSAQDFAKGGVDLLNSLGVVDYLSCGVETSNIDLIEQAVEYSFSADFQNVLKNYLSDGYSYGEAIRKIFSKALSQADDLFYAPNNILALEYLKAIKALNSKIRFLPIKRAGANHHDKEIYSKISSASAIRENLQGQEPTWDKIKLAVSETVFSMLREEKAKGLPDYDKIFLPLALKILNSKESQLKNICGMNEGLENRVIEQIAKAKNIDEFINAVTTKRYPRGRIRRLIIHALLEFTKSDAELFNKCGNLYIRPLAFNANGRELLHSIKAKSGLPIVGKVGNFIHTADLHRPLEADEILQKMLLYEVKSTELRRMAQGFWDKSHRDFTVSPIFLK